MKKFFKLNCLPIVLISIFYHSAFGQTPLLRAKPSQNIEKQQLSVSLPLLEDWSSASFETYGWTTECDNWEINNQQGNPGSTAEFKWDPMLQNNYLCSLVSDDIIGSQIHVGQIFFDFDISLDNRNNTGTELFIVEVFDGSGWEIITSFSNDLGFDWESYHFDITEHARSNNFQVRFSASGENSYNVLSWFVDNISVYRTCAAPDDLSFCYYWNSGLDFGSSVTWDAPDILFPPQSTWLHWDNGYLYTGLGLLSGGDFSVATRWDVDQLNIYENDTIKKVKIHLQDTGFQNIVLKIWKGENASELIYKDTLTDVTSETWMEISIDTVLLVPEDEELWVGYTIIEQISTSYPSGADIGPAVAGYGDLISTDGISWDPLSSYGQSYNWNIQVFLETPTASDTTSMLGFNVFRKVDEEPDYTFRSFVPFDSEQHYEFRETLLENDLYYTCYKVNGVWGLMGDSCISNYALNHEYPSDDFACIFTANTNDSKHSQIQIYPNPATNKLTISTNTDTPIREIVIYNRLGQTVLQVNEPHNSIDVSMLENGIYFIEIITIELTIRNKLLIR